MTGCRYSNGVTHQVVSNDLEGVSGILDWLSFVPRISGADLPETPSADNIDRDVTFVPDKTSDPRWLIAGRSIASATEPVPPQLSPLSAGTGTSGTAPPVSTDEWQSGLFDKGSFIESLGGWARTVIVGRARLGGIPMGVITSEVAPITCRSPADPAAPDSRETTVVQAGGVWYPDSAYKTAQVR